jgi:hypothetical protein
MTLINLSPQVRGDQYFGAMLTRNYIAFSSYFVVKFELNELYQSADVSIEPKRGHLIVTFRRDKNHGNYKIKILGDYQVRINCREASKHILTGRYQLSKHSLTDTTLQCFLEKI